MRVLALETSGFSGSVAAAENDLLLGEITLGPRQRTGQSLAPALRDLLAQVGWQPRDVQLVAVTQGPGSFTGLRVGVTTAKSFAYASGAALIGVDTLEVLAEQVSADQKGEPLPTLAAVMNAEREQLFAATFAVASTGGWQMTEATRIVDRIKWIESIQPNMAVTGPGLESLAEILPSHIPRIDEPLWRPQAAAVARIGLRDYLAGRRDNLWKLLPNYYRESAAEEKISREGAKLSFKF